MGKQIEGFSVGSEVRHKLMGWDGIIIVDLRRNQWAVEDWQVRFKVNEDLETKNVYQTEIESR